MTNLCDWRCTFLLPGMHMYNSDYYEAGLSLSEAAQPRRLPLVEMNLETKNG